MEQNIYLDVYFGFNFLMDFFVLFITKNIIRNHKTYLRSVVAAAIGAFYAVIVLVFPAGELMRMIGTYVIIMEIMIFVAFGKMRLRQNLKTALVLYMVTFITSGAINFCYYGSMCSDNPAEAARVPAFGKIALMPVVFTLTVIAAVTPVVIKKIRGHVLADKKMCDVKLDVGGEKIKVTALVDTGNSLIEPMTQKPVSVIETDAIKGINKDSLRYLVVPYNSVGTSHGLMNAFIADRMIMGENTVNNAIIGIYEGKLSQNGRYNMILHPDFVNKGEER